MNSDGTKPMLSYFQIDPLQKTKCYTILFIRDNAFENVVCKVVAIGSALNVLKPIIQRTNKLAMILLPRRPVIKYLDAWLNSQI